MRTIHWRNNISYYNRFSTLLFLDFVSKFIVLDHCGTVGWAKSRWKTEAEEEVPNVEHP